MNTKTSILLFASIILTMSLLAVETPKYSKIIVNEQFDISSSALLKIKNKYGNISCSNWDKQSVSIKVIVNVEANSQKEADKLLSSISVSLDHSASLIDAETKFGGSWGKSKNNNLSVDYQILMPVSLKIDIDNSFGAIVLEQVNEKAILLSAYGSLTADKLNGIDNRVNVEFGKGTVNEMKSGSLNVKYSNFNLNHGENIKAVFKYSDLEVEAIDLLDINIEGGKLKANKINSLTGITKFTDVKVFSLMSQVNLSLEYGNVNIIELKPEVSNVKLISKFSGIKLGISPLNTYKIIAETKFGDFTYPKANANFTNIEKSPTYSKYEGTIGKGKLITKVFLDSEYGGVKLETY